MKRIAMLTAAVLMLLAVYLFQRVSYAALWNYFTPHFLLIENANAIFAFNRAVRLILNDSSCIVLIWVLFNEKKYLQVAFYVFLIELLVILPVYLILKLSLEGDSEISAPWLSQVHRLIINPLLMLLLIFGLIYQRMKQENNNLG